MAYSRTAGAALALPVIYALWRVLGRALRQHFIRTMTVLYDIPNLGTPRPDRGRIEGTAVVCGGSIAGLWTARVCADHFEDVVIIEPEAWLATERARSNLFDERGEKARVQVAANGPDADADSGGHTTRTRVPQYRAQHVFQPMVLQALRQFFPTIEDDIKQADGRIADGDYGVQVCGRTLPFPYEEYAPGKSPQGFFITRESYERLLRRLVMGSSKRIRWVVGTAVGVQAKASREGSEHDILESVQVRQPDGTEVHIRATLVVDCTGGTQAGLKWLRRLYTPPTSSAPTPSTALRGTLAFDAGLRTEYNTLQRYTKFRFTIPAARRDSLPVPGGYNRAAWLYTYLPWPGRERKTFMTSRIEGHRIEIAFGGWGERVLPQAPSEIGDWLKTLEAEGRNPIPGWIYDFLDALLDIAGDGESEVEMEQGKYPSCSWIHYENAPRMPSNFVAIGDAVMVVNPTFGQGCSKAAIGAITLDKQLRTLSTRTGTLPVDFGSAFFKVHARRIASGWDGTKPTDYQWDTTTPAKGERLSDERLAGALSTILMQLSGRDKSVSSALWHVRVFLAPPTDLLHPRILLKVLAFAAKQRLGLVKS
ncbi:hypothetical protein M0805_008658 [Coniferiporia weirii]|nr:hypothetical protein M0805_008658 [Coniferiporia weirii]